MEFGWKPVISSMGTNTCHMPSMYRHGTCSIFQFNPYVDLDHEELLQG